VNVLKFLMLLALAIWIGGIIFFGAVLAPTVFSVLPTHQLAGNVVAPALRKLHLIGLFCGAVYLVCSMVESYMGRGFVQQLALRHIAVLMMMGLTLFSQYAVAKRMNRMRAEMGVIDDLPVNDPRRVDFNRLHVWSTRLEGCVLVIGLGVLYGTGRRLS
jgi:putative copper export protein